MNGEANSLKFNDRRGRSPEAPSAAPAENPPMGESILIPLRATNETEAVRMRELANELIRLAGRDDHSVVAPTHLVMRDGQIVGYLSLGGMTHAHCWFDTKVQSPRHTIDMMRHGETILREKGILGYVVSCPEHSPFTPHMERLGFKKLFPTVLWRKVL